MINFEMSIYKNPNEGLSWFIWNAWLWILSDFTVKFFVFIPHKGRAFLCCYWVSCIEAETLWVRQACCVTVWQCDSVTCPGCPTCCPSCGRCCRDCAVTGPRLWPRCPLTCWLSRCPHPAWPGSTAGGVACWRMRLTSQWRCRPWPEWSSPQLRSHGSRAASRGRYWERREWRRTGRWGRGRVGTGSGSRRTTGEVGVQGGGGGGGQSAGVQTVETSAREAGEVEWRAARSSCLAEIESGGVGVLDWGAETGDSIIYYIFYTI